MMISRRKRTLGKSAAHFKEDFDQIAPLSDNGWNHNIRYYKYLLKHIPHHCEDVLDVGCGIGEFSRLLARRSKRVLAFDLSPESIRIAEEQSKQHSNIDFRVADAMTYEYPNGQFDCIVSIATLHHLEADETLSKLRKALKPNGSLIILDVLQEEGVYDKIFAFAVVAVLANTLLRLLKTGRISEPRELRKAMGEHQKNETYLTLSQVHELCRSVLPEAIMKRHLLWRYSIIYRKGPAI